LSRGPHLKKKEAEEVADDFVLYEVKEWIATITLNRPDVLNALTPALLVELREAVERAGRDDEVGVVVLTGAGRAFSAGVDLKALEENIIDGGSGSPALNESGQALIDTIQSVAKAVIAKVNGFCLTGALEIVLGCDLIVAAEEAKLGDTHARWGLRPTLGMSARLPRAVGIHRAKELSFTGDMITGGEAARIGLVNSAVPADQLDDAVQEMADKILANSRGSIAAYKYLYRHGAATTLADALELELESTFEIDDTEERTRQFLKGDD
jgi:enoyl-CoA hydratase/carnithine racemase